MATLEPTVIGAQVVKPTAEKVERQDPPSPNCLTTVSSIQSDLSAVANPKSEFDPCVGAKPFSPFYRHATPTGSAERLTLEVKRPSGDDNNNNKTHQLESGGFSLHGQSFDGLSRQKSKLWKDDRKSRNPLNSLPPKQRFAVKIIIAVVMLGTMIAIAVGITAAVGGGVWRPNNQQGKLGSP